MSLLLSYIRVFIYLAIFSFATICASDASLLNRYQVSRGYCLSKEVLIHESIKITEKASDRPEQEIAVVESNVRREGGVELVELKNLAVNEGFQGRGFGTFLFDLAVFRLMREHGANQVTWSPFPFRFDRDMATLIAWYLKRGGGS